MNRSVALMILSSWDKYGTRGVIDYAKSKDWTVRGLISRATNAILPAGTRFTNTIYENTYTYRDELRYNRGVKDVVQKSIPHFRLGDFSIFTGAPTKISNLSYSDDMLTGLTERELLSYIAAGEDCKGAKMREDLESLYDNKYGVLDYTDMSGDEIAIYEADRQNYVAKYMRDYVDHRIKDTVVSKIWNNLQEGDVEDTDLDDKL
jgi:hypothetical protein